MDDCGCTVCHRLSMEAAQRNQNARIGFSTSQSWLSALIRFLTRSRVSHAFILYWDRDFMNHMILEATHDGFRLVTVERFLAHNTVVELIDVGRTLNQGLSHVSAWVGSRYDAMGLVGMVWVVLGRWLRRRWHNPLGSSRSMFCSEAIVRALRADGFPGADSLDPEATSPADLLAFLYSSKLS